MLFRMKIAGRGRHTIEFIDSLNFLLAPLTQLPKTFGLDSDTRKKYFPHFYNTDANLNVRLNRLPDVKYYGFESMAETERKSFLEWHHLNRNQPFCLRDELPIYCEMDVRILRQSCCKFRSLILAQTGLDPFRTSATIAKLTMQIFQYRFLELGTIANVPENGYRPADPQSIKGLKWLRWYAHENNVRVQTAESAKGEFRIQIEGKNYRPDGVVSAKFFLSHSHFILGFEQQRPSGASA